MIVANAIPPAEWSSYQVALAKDALNKLTQLYPHWSWAVDIADSQVSLGLLTIKLKDVATEECYYIHPKDVDRVELKCVMRGGAILLEALGLTRKGGSEGEQFYKATNAKGLIYVDPAAMKETQPGYTDNKKHFEHVQAREQAKAFFQGADGKKLKAELSQLGY